MFYENKDEIIEIIKTLMNHDIVSVDIDEDDDIVEVEIRLDYGVTELISFTK